MPVSVVDGSTVRPTAGATGVALLATEASEGSTVGFQASQARAAVSSTCRAPLMLSSWRPLMATGDHANLIMAFFLVVTVCR